MINTVTAGKFPFDWIIRFTEYLISYRVAKQISADEDAICSIIGLKGGEIGKAELGSLLGFNLTNEHSGGIFRDEAEVEVYGAYLKKLEFFKLIAIEHATVHITASGRDAVRTGLRYDYSSAVVNHYDCRYIPDQLVDFSYKREFDLPNKFTPAPIPEYTTKVNEPLLLQRLQSQLFDNDQFNGEVTAIYKINGFPEYKSIGLDCVLSSDATEISLFYKESEKPRLAQIIKTEGNEFLLELLIKEGRFHRLLKSGKLIGLTEVNEFLGLWKWNLVAENPHINWAEPEILEEFSKHADGFAWKILSQSFPEEILADQLENYIEYWHWDVLTDRMDDDFIVKNSDYFPWDFQVISGKNTDFIIRLLKVNELKTKHWDWTMLSSRLPDEFIINNISNYLWDYYLITTVKFDVFKEVFIDDPEGQLKNPWNWQHVSVEIKLNYLYKHITVLAPYISWPVVMERLFSDPILSEACISNRFFEELIRQWLPENFVITRQRYIWHTASISFFDRLGLISWITTNYIPGFDANSYVTWNEDIFAAFSAKIQSREGFVQVSRSVSKPSIVWENKSFPWDWSEISRNRLVVGDPSFLEKIIRSPDTGVFKLKWQLILPMHDLDFWNGVLGEINDHISLEDSADFWSAITVLEKPEFIYSRLQFPWDWSALTEIFESSVIISTFNVKSIAGKWNWEVLTRKLNKDQVLLYLETCCSFWDWPYIITRMVKPAELTLANGQLSRFAACLDSLESDDKKQAWQALTSIFSIAELFDYTIATASNKYFNWDWDYISVQKHLPTDIRTLNSLKNNLNWTLFSNSDTVKRKFNYTRWGNDKKAGTDFIRKYLKSFIRYWDWKVLSQNKDLNSNRALLSEFRNLSWDWEYLSLNGKFLIKKGSDRSDYLIDLLKSFPVHFESISKRTDVELSSDLILHFRDKLWDWESLSSNYSVKLTAELLKDLSSRQWNWHHISFRKDLVIDNNLLISLKEKEWNWGYLADSSTLIFDAEFLNVLLDKPWDWIKISRHNTFIPTSELLALLATKPLDWALISASPVIIPTGDVIERFKSKWNWDALTKNPMLDCSDIALITKYKDKWDWNYLCTRTNLPLNESTLTAFETVLDWNALSLNTAIVFSAELIEKYQMHWNWRHLKENHHIRELLGDNIDTFINNSPRLKFLSQIISQSSSWAGSVYHFSHIENAIQIINQQKIQSRNIANILGDAAGNVVHRRGDAHDFARFYFRPKTPTQFYNEFLGKGKNEGYFTKEGTFVSWYDKARLLGYPKCPVPIFFKISLQELLFKYPESCYVSSGNMQTTATSFGRIDEMDGKFNAEDLFYTPQQYANADDYRRYRSYAQQEFLFRDELNLRDLDSLQIICASAEDKQLLINLIDDNGTDFSKKINIDTGLYNQLNSRVNISKNNGSVKVRPNLPGKGYLTLSPFDELTDKIIEGEADLIKNGNLNFSNWLEIEEIKHPFKITYTDESDRKWFLYESKGVNQSKSKDDTDITGNYKDYRLTKEVLEPQEIINYLKSNGFETDYEATVRHYTLEEHTLLVCKAFEKYFSRSMSDKESNFFRIMLAVHDLGKPRAFQTGNKERQYEFTLRILDEIADRLPFSSDDFKLLKALLASDILGEYFQSQVTLKEAVEKLAQLNSGTRLGITEFFRFMMIYYQCDTASYTADDGGLKFLEKLFNYKEGKKIMNKREDLIQFSSRYWDLYLELKKEVELCL
jgi:hypothetical protein